MVSSCAWAVRPAQMVSRPPGARPAAVCWAPEVSVRLRASGMLAKSTKVRFANSCAWL